MINLTLEVMFIKKGKDLQKSIARAVSDTRTVLFNAYSEGSVISNCMITSSTRNPYSRLQFCKYFNKENIEYITLKPEVFVKECYRIYSGKKPKKSELSALIPHFDDIKHEITALSITHIVRGMGVMLFALWRHGAIILPPKYRQPLTVTDTGHTRHLCEELHSEVIGFFYKFREKVIGSNSSGYKLAKSDTLSTSLQHNLQSSSCRMIMATDWHYAEDVCPKEAVEFLEAMADHKAGKASYTHFPVPIKTMLSMLKDEFGDRAQYTFDEFLDARQKTFKKPSVTEDYSPYNLYEGKFLPDIAGFDLSTISKEWAKTQIDYIEARKRKGIKKFDAAKNTFSILNQFLLFNIPAYQRENGLPISVPERPTELTRKYIEGADDTPSLLDKVMSGRGSATAYNHLRNIDDYLTHIEKKCKIDGGTFINPFHRKIDFPLSGSRDGTSKKIISQHHLPSMIAYSYAAMDFVWHIIEVITDSDPKDGKQEHINKLIEDIPGDYDSWIDTEAFGFVPFITHKEKLYPIKKIHKSIFSLANRQVKHHGPRKVPNYIYLAQFITAFETGIRNLHIKWLDADVYDIKIDRETPLPPICQLYVSTDKVKTKPWTAHVSHRVIRILDRLNALRGVFDEPWTNSRYWYDDHADSPFGEIKPLFSKGGDTPSDGRPCNENTHREHFCKILIQFQEFANTNKLFSTPLDIARVEVYKDKRGYKSRRYITEVSPHSARATVVSHHIKILPPHVIGKYITGHESDQMVAYYSVLDPAYMARIEKGQALSVAGLNPLLDTNDFETINAEAFNSALQSAINKNIDDAFSDFGATSFEHEKSNGSVESGIIIAKSVGPAQLAYNSTHICPYNNTCPDEIKIEVGERSCGQCWASIKTVDHLPTINAHIRKLHSMHEEKADEVKRMLSEGVSESIIEQHEVERNKIASEEASWIATSAILEEFREDLARRDDYLAGKPEIIEKQLQLISNPSTPLTDMLVRIRDAQNYPEYFTPQLQASITKIRNKILAQNGNLDAIINQPDGYKLLDEFRGIIRGICDASNTTIEELSRVMNTELPKGNTFLLEAL